MSTRDAFTQKRFKDLSDSLWAARVGGHTTTTFSLYRRLEDGPPNDLGMPTTSYHLIATNVPCIYNGSFSKRSERFFVKDPGQFQREMSSLYTSYQDIHAGDNVVLSFDGKGYHVQSAVWEGNLRRVELDEMQQAILSS